MAMVPVATQLIGVDLVKRITEGGVPKDATQRSGYPLPNDLAEELRAMVARGATVFEGPAIMVKMPYPEPPNAPTLEEYNRFVAAASQQTLTVCGRSASPAPDPAPSRVIEIMRLEGENASLRAALADLRAEYAALFALHIKQPAPIADAAPEFPVRALKWSV